MKDALTNDEVIAELRKRGIAQVKIAFDGGNDEGGPNEMVCVNAAGEMVTAPERTYSDGWSTVSREWVPATPEPQQELDNRLWEGLNAPIFAHWGTFAGEFYVYGTVTWDVTTGHATLAYDESVSDYDHHEEVY